MERLRASFLSGLCAQARNRRGYASGGDILAERKGLAQEGEDLEAGVAVGDEAARFLEGLYGGDGLGAHPAIDAAGIKACFRQAVLEFAAFV